MGTYGKEVKPFTAEGFFDDKPTCRTVNKLSNDDGLRM